MRRVTWCCLTVTQLFNVKEGSQSEYMISWCGLKTLQCVFEGSVLMVLKWLWVSVVRADDDLKSRSEDEEPVLRSAAFLAFPVETWDWGIQRLSYGKVGEHWEKLVNLNKDFHFLSFLFLIIFLFLFLFFLPVCPFLTQVKVICITNRWFITCLSGIRHCSDWILFLLVMWPITVDLRWYCPVLHDGCSPWILTNLITDEE